jgi:hypothetical protein
MWNIFRAPPIDRRGRFGIKFKWSDEIERVRRQVEAIRERIRAINTDTKEERHGSAMIPPFAPQF